MKLLVAMFTLVIAVAVAEDGNKPTVSGRILVENEFGVSVPVSLFTLNFTSQGNVVGTATTGAEGQFVVKLDPGHYTVQGVSLTKWFEIRDTFGTPYYFNFKDFDVTADATGVSLGDFTIAYDTTKTGVLLIQNTAAKVIGMLGKLIGIVPGLIANSPLSIVFPAATDGFDGVHSNITDTQWDVNTQNIAHGIYVLLTKGATDYSFQNSLSQCTNDQNALFEGWSLFFTAAVWLDPKDPDAKFPFLSALGSNSIENLPAGLCTGTSNAWRVAAYLWDLYDSNNDGADTVQIPFTTLLSVLQQNPIKSIGEFATALKQLSVADPQALDAVWQQNMGVAAPSIRR